MDIIKMFLSIIRPLSRKTLKLLKAYAKKTS